MDTEQVSRMVPHRNLAKSVKTRGKFEENRRGKVEKFPSSGKADFIVRQAGSRGRSTSSRKRVLSLRIGTLFWIVLGCRKTITKYVYKVHSSREKINNETLKGFRKSSTSASKSAVILHRLLNVENFKEKPLKNLMHSI